MNTIEGDGYTVAFDPDSHCVKLMGILRLHGTEAYEPISNLIRSALKDTDKIELNLQKLEFLNSSGIAMLSKIVIDVRKSENIDLMIKGSNSIPWQGKSLNNLKRLMPNIVLTLE